MLGSGRVFFAPSAFDPLDRPFNSHDGFCGRLETQGDSLIFLLETGGFLADFWLEI